METVLHDLIDIHVLGEWKKTSATIPAHATAAMNYDKTSCNLSLYSVGKVVLDLGKTESYINHKLHHAKHSSTQNNDDAIVKSGGGTVGNSVLLHILMAPNDINLEILTNNDLGVSTTMYHKCNF